MENNYLESGIKILADMKENNDGFLLEEHLRKIKYRTAYKINESPRYHPLVNTDEQFDNVPDQVNMTDRGTPQPAGPNLRLGEVGDQEDAEKQGVTPPEPSNADVPEGGMPPLPEPEAGIDVPTPEGGMPPVEDGLPAGEPAPPSPEQEVDNIQNDIIRHNVEAMKSIQMELENLTNSVQGLNAKLDELNADVEEVREPTNAEKLMSKKDVSYPYYFNLNDFWSNNWFEEQRKLQGDGGIRELPDGSYIADFDDLPQKSKMDIQDSFNDLV